MIALEDGPKRFAVSPTPDSALADPHQIIADVRRELDEGMVIGWSKIELLITQPSTRLGSISAFTAREPPLPACNQAGLR
jgi:hypothetical protein